MSTTHADGAGAAPFRGNDRLLLGIVLAVLTFWLFAGTVGTAAPAMMRDFEQRGGRITAEQMNLAVSITALVSGLFIVFLGGLADRVGRVRVTLVGLGAGILGSLLVVLAAGPAAFPLLLLGRAVQGLSAACIMPASMAVVKAYWDGPARQRAVSMWSIGSWGGAGTSALFGGAMATSFGWRSIFVASIVVSVVAFLLIMRTPETRAARPRRTHPFDLVGLMIFMVAVLAVMIVLIFGQSLGWTSLTTLLLAAVAVAGTVGFVLWERRQGHPFVDFSLFSNTTFTGATLSNFILNATIGLLIVSQQLLQKARPEGHPEAVSAGEAGLLTIGYAVAIIAFIRVGERMLQRLGPRLPMIWGSLIVGVTCLLLMPTWVLLDTYRILAVAAYILFGVGLAFYATPSTDAALANLPMEQAGAGAGIYKMASSLGSAIGAAMSLAIFTGLSGAEQIGNVITYSGIQDNIDLRQAGMVVMIVNLLLVAAAVIAIVVTVPRGGGSRDLGVVLPPAPEPQAAPDAEREAVLARLAHLSTEELVELERTRVLLEMSRLDPEVLRRLLRPPDR